LRDRVIGKDKEGGIPLLALHAWLTTVGSQRDVQIATRRHAWQQEGTKTHSRWGREGGDQGCFFPRGLVVGKDKRRYSSELWSKHDLHID